MMNRFVKNGRVRKFCLTEITGPLLEVIPNILVGRTDRNFRNLCIGLMVHIRGSGAVLVGSEEGRLFSQAKARSKRRSIHAPNLTDELSTAEERRLNQFGSAD